MSEESRSVQKVVSPTGQVWLRRPQPGDVAATKEDMKVNFRPEFKLVVLVTVLTFLLVGSFQIRTISDQESSAKARIASLIVLEKSAEPLTADLSSVLSSRPADAGVFRNDSPGNLILIPSNSPIRYLRLESPLPTGLSVYGSYIGSQWCLKMVSSNNQSALYNQNGLVESDLKVGLGSDSLTCLAGVAYKNDLPQS